MKKTLYLALLAATLLAPMPALAAKQYATQEEAAAAVTDDGYILVVYAKGWDRFSEAFCKKIIADPEIIKAAGEAALILTPFYQYSTSDERTAQRAVWGALAEPRSNSMETYPSLLMYDKAGYLYGRVQGTLLMRGTMTEIAADVKAKLDAKRQQEAIMEKAKAASGVEKAKLIAEACAFENIEWPNGARQMVKEADPSDQSGMVRRLNFDFWGFSQKYAGKKSDGGMEMTSDDMVKTMKEFLEDPAYTNEQKQAFYACMIGQLRRDDAAGNRDEIKRYALEIKKLNPNSNLGVTSDQIIKLWCEPDKKKGK